MHVITYMYMYPDTYWVSCYRHNMQARTLRLGNHSSLSLSLPPSPPPPRHTIIRLAYYIFNFKSINYDVHNYCDYLRREFEVCALCHGTAHVVWLTPISPKNYHRLVTFTFTRTTPQCDPNLIIKGSLPFPSLPPPSPHTPHTHVHTYYAHHLEHSHAHTGQLARPRSPLWYVRNNLREMSS
jgi:hypothetical protein